MKKKVFVYRELKVTLGEYEFECKGVHDLNVDANNVADEINKFGDDYAKNFYGNGEGEGDDSILDGTYYFNAGEVAVELTKIQEITEADFNVLKLFL